MSTVAPSPAAVLEAVDILAPPGTPLTTPEVADEFDCTARTIYNKLQRLVDEDALETKKVGARGRVWWRPAEEAAGAGPDATRSGSWTAAVDSRANEQQHSKERFDRPNLYEAVFNQTAQFIGLLEPDGTLVDANEAALAFGEVSRDAVVGTPFWEAHWWQHAEDARSRLKDAIDGAADGELVRYETEIQDTDRTTTVDFSLRPVTNDEGEVTLLVSEARDIDARKERERQLQRVDRLNTVIRTIGQAVARSETRADMAQTVCETLLEFDAYQAAVIGEFSQSFDDFEPWAMTGGIETYIEQVRTEAGPSLGESIGASAARTGELQARHDLSEVPSEYWQTLATSHAIRSYAAIPLVFQETTYGVLGVYADRPDEFDREKRRILTELGEIVGYALYALERKEVLDPTVELAFESPQIAQLFRAETDAEFELTLDSVVPLSDGTQRQFWTVEGLSPQIVRTVLGNSVPTVTDPKLLKKVGETARFQVTADEESTAAIFDRFDGHLRSVTVEDETATLIGRFPKTVDSTAVTRAVRERYPDVELVATRGLLTPTYLRRLVDDQLTDRQRTVLRLAYFGGYYEQPRLSTGAELAAELGISKQTFHHHLRAAEATVCYHLFEEPSA